MNSVLIYLELFELSSFVIPIIRLHIQDLIGSHLEDFETGLALSVEILFSLR